MWLAGRIAPARIWRAFFVFSLAALSLRAAAPAKPPELAQVGLPDAAETKQILEQFRKSGVAGQYFFEFELHALPRRGDETVFRGRLWAGRNEQGAINRVEVTDASGKTRRLLVQNGEQARLWRFDGVTVKSLGAAEAFEPLIPGLEITAFDLQMPFLYWPDARVERVARSFRGRPANVFLFPTPASARDNPAKITAVRAYLDTQYNALMQVEYLGANGVLKTIALVDLKKIGEQYIPKSFDVRNEVTRDKTRFLVTAAALDLQLAPAVFEPATLAEAVQSPGRLAPVSP
jgi:hypothetical protein